MDDVKSLVESRTFWSAFLALAAIVANVFHLSRFAAWAADPASIDAIMNGVAMAGAVGAIIFRAVATKQIAGVTPGATTRSPFAVVLAALFLTAGLSSCQQIQVSFNADSARLRAMASAFEVAAAGDVAAIQAAAPRIAADIQTAANVLLDINSIAQAAVSSGLVPATRQSIRDLNALASSPTLAAAANGTLPSSPVTLAAQILQTYAAVKSASAGITATAAVVKAGG